MKLIGTSQVTERFYKIPPLCCCCHTYVPWNSIDYVVGEHEFDEERKSFGDIKHYCQTCFSKMFDDLQKKCACSCDTEHSQEEWEKLRKRAKNASRWQSERDSALKTLKSAVPQKDYERVCKELERLKRLNAYAETCIRRLNIEALLYAETGRMNCDEVESALRDYHKMKDCCKNSKNR